MDDMQLYLCQKEDPSVWTGIRNMEFPTLNDTPSFLIVTMRISTIFQKLDYRDHGYVTPGERDAWADRH